LTRYEDMPENPVAQLFWGKLELQAAAALWHFSKAGPVQQIMHKIKYRGDRALAEFVGKEMGKALARSDQFKDIDLVLPVPLHPKKERKRGFNQSALIATGLAAQLDVPTEATILKRVTKTSTQTRKSRLQRWQNVKDVFELSDTMALKGKHILLVDDVVTTGATLESCIACMHDSCDTQISLYAAAVA